MPDYTDSLDKLEGLILIKEEENDILSTQLDKFNFELEDSKVNTQLVEEIDTNLSKLNKLRYYLTHTVKKITTSLEKQKIIFDPEEAETLYSEAGVLFSEQIKKTYIDLIKFNRDITSERQLSLRETLKYKQKELKEAIHEIKELNNQREVALKYLNDSKTVEKYKQLS